MASRSTGHNGSFLAAAGEGFEWWYLHAASQELFLTVTAHLTDVVGNRGSGPYVSASLMLGGESPVHHTVPAGIRTPDGRLHAPPLLQEHAEGWTVALDLPRYGVSLSIARIGGPWRADRTSLLEGTGPDGTAHWSVPMPLARFHGEVRTPGGTHEVEGWAYQDHNWGAAPLHQAFTAWRWGVLSGRCGAEIWAVLLRRGGSALRLGTRIDGAGRAVDRPGAGCDPRRGTVLGGPLKRRDYGVDALRTASYVRWPGTSGDGDCAHFGMMERFILRVPGPGPGRGMRP
ncbi:hypothetical protein ACFV7R_43845 [Streptomyces sp. NPDC059866]|uniref:hypothetical protein n=1 Tax=Streptomyces sp. NPDC059866 TaxID=3346978 RepID=UPI003654DB80